MAALGMIKKVVKADPPLLPESREIYDTFKFLLSQSFDGMGRKGITSQVVKDHLDLVGIVDPFSRKIHYLGITALQSEYNQFKAEEREEEEAAKKQERLSE